MVVSLRVLSFGALFAALAAYAAPANGEVRVPDGFVSETMVTGLEQPNSMAFLPDGRVLFTEQKTARVRMVVNGQLATTDPVLTVDNVETNGYERGLQGIAVDPGWPTRPYVYLYYTHTSRRCFLERYTASGDLADSAGQNVTLADPLRIIDDILDEDPNHQAGCLRFAPDGYLFVSLGEDEDPCAARDSTQLKGALLRIRVDGLPASSPGTVLRELIIPEGNPLSTPDSNARLVWAYGMRNPWRFHIDPQSPAIYLSDVGEEDFEELNEVLPGDYLGWPYREGFRIMPRFSCPEPDGEGATPYKAPIVAMAHNPNLTAIIAAGIYRPVAGAASNWPQSYWGDVFYGEYYSGILRRIKKAGDTWVPAGGAPGQADPESWAGGLISAVDYQIGRDGSLWWLRQFNDVLESRTGSLGRIRATEPDTTNTSTLITFTRAEASVDRVNLEWYATDAAISATLYRREERSSWEARGAVTSDGTGRIVYEDRDVVAGRRYSYRLGVVEAGSERYFGETSVEVPARLGLAVYGIRPNPAPRDFVVSFALATREPARLEFVDVAGRRVLERVLEPVEPGNRLLNLWGTDLPAGVYVVRVSQSGRTASARAVIAR